MNNSELQKADDSFLVHLPFSAHFTEHVQQYWVHNRLMENKMTFIIKKLGDLWCHDFDLDMASRSNATVSYCKRKTWTRHVFKPSCSFNIFGRETLFRCILVQTKFKHMYFFQLSNLRHCNTVQSCKTGKVDHLRMPCLCTTMKSYPNVTRNKRTVGNAIHSNTVLEIGYREWKKSLH